MERLGAFSIILERANRPMHHVIEGVRRNRWQSQRLGGDDLRKWCKTMHREVCLTAGAATRQKNGSWIASLAHGLSQLPVALRENERGAQLFLKKPHWPSLAGQNFLRPTCFCSARRCALQSEVKPRICQKSF